MANRVKEFVRRISSQDLELYPDWDLTSPLPRQPIPELRNTLQRYLRLVAPVVSPSDFERTQRIINEFGISGGVGEHLQALLRQYAEKKDNWVTDWWLTDMYLKNPLPLPINSNPGMVFPIQKFSSTRQKIRFASQLISGILDYKTILDTRSLPIERARHNRKGQPLCMEQYYRLFNSYRYPGEERDSLQTFSNHESEYIIVAYNNQFYQLDLISNGVRLREEEFYIQLRRICQEVDALERLQPKIGILTSLSRPKWAKVRSHLIEISEVNKRNLEIIAKSMFILALDKIQTREIDSDSEEESSETSYTDTLCNETSLTDEEMARQMLYGINDDMNVSNRWYDKTMQFIISKSGICGLNYEHSCSEGIAVIRLIEHILEYMNESDRWKLTRYSSVCERPGPKHLLWKVDQTIEREISKAIEEIQQLGDDLDLHVLRFKNYGREFPKTVNMSPDSYIQLALQLTYYRLYGHLVPTYESASTRRFHLGRVDNIRACSIPALEWCKSMCHKPAKNKDENIRLLRKAMDWQTEVMLETILGYGVDNHLLGLKEICLENNLDLPSVFTDRVYLDNFKFKLSTSQVPTTKDAFMCYGAVVPDGYGVAYNPHPDNIVVVVSSFNSSPKTNSKQYAETLDGVFNEMRELVISNPELAKKKSSEPLTWSIPEETSA